MKYNKIFIVECSLFVPQAVTGGCVLGCQLDTAGLLSEEDWEFLRVWQVWECFAEIFYLWEESFPYFCVFCTLQ